MPDNKGATPKVAKNDPGLAVLRIKAAVAKQGPRSGTVNVRKGDFLPLFYCIVRLHPEMEVREAIVESQDATVWDLYSNVPTVHTATCYTRGRVFYQGMAPISPTEINDEDRSKAEAAQAALQAELTA